ncbi:F-box only protein 16 [Eucyclogobius newberryi]|uniref:F-box only protein 16 n=1 Tax=Eucyclogobius newberryi TaxID=166745 RepID=UPI003B5AA6AF
MPQAPKSSVNGTKMQTKRSAWTPLNHAPSNRQLFEERRALLAKWFSMWTDSQRKTILQDLIQSCSLDQLMLLSHSVRGRLPLQATDFTCMLPRALSLYIFSYLDPRSLCRCAQVSWRWKNIVDLDQLWMVKCLRRGWFLDFSPTQFEVCVWKRHYISTVQRLRSQTEQQQQQQQQNIDWAPEELRLEDALLSEPPPESNISSTKKTKQNSRSSLSLPPWRDSDRKPRDIVRFNYLDNSVDEAWTAKTQSPGSRCNSATNAPGDSSKPELGHKTLSDAHYKLRKAKSLMLLSSNSRPPPPLSSPLDQSEHRIHSAASVVRLLRESQFNAAVRPGPVRSAVPRLSLKGLRTAQRSHRSIPSAPLLDFIQPWTVSTLPSEQ